MAKFKIGDNVVARTNAPYVITTGGWRGTVVGTLENPNGYLILPCDDICVKDNNNDDDDYYSLNSKYFDFDESNQKIVITTDGKTTTAKMYDGKKFVKAAKAICSPEDEFDIMTGTMIAFSRLFDADIRFVDPFDWDEFKNNEVFVQVTKDNFDEFIKEAEKHGCFFKDHDEFNPFDDIRAFTCLLLFKMRNENIAAPDGTLFVVYHDEMLKVTSVNHDNKTVFVW